MIHIHIAWKAFQCSTMLSSKVIFTYILNIAIKLVKNETKIENKNNVIYSIYNYVQRKYKINSKNKLFGG